MNRLEQSKFHQLCDRLAAGDPQLKGILDAIGYPPFWTRPNSYETLVLTILEQQVSLLSAYAAYKRLKEKIDPVTPAALLALSDEELRLCSFTRQKIVYARGLATALEGNVLSLQALEFEEDEVVRTELKKLKGIGDWTADIYLLHALRRTDIFPLGDLALVNALKEVKELPKETTKEELLLLGEPWRPYRSVATMMLWHYYIRKRNIKLVA